MKLIYVAGPYSGKTTWETECHIQEARRLGAEVAKLGAMPVIPHSNTSHFDGIQNYDFWLRGTLELARRCDALITVDGWRGSKGARAEVEEMLKLGRPVFHDILELRQFLYLT